MRPTHRSPSFFTGALLWAASVSTTPSGLNNIPTADTTPQGVLVIRAFSHLGDSRDADFPLGSKTGLDLFGQAFEFGADSYRTVPSGWAAWVSSTP